MITLSYGDWLNVFSLSDSATRQARQVLQSVSKCPTTTTTTTTTTSGNDGTQSPPSMMPPTATQQWTEERLRNAMIPSHWHRVTAIAALPTVDQKRKMSAAAGASLDEQQQQQQKQQHLLVQHPLSTREFHAFRLLSSLSCFSHLTALDASGCSITNRTLSLLVHEEEGDGGHPEPTQQGSSSTSSSGGVAGPVSSSSSLPTTLRVVILGNNDVSDVTLLLRILPRSLHYLWLRGNPELVHYRKALIHAIPSLVGLDDWIVADGERNAYYDERASSVVQTSIQLAARTRFQPFSRTARIAESLRTQHWHDVNKLSKSLWRRYVRHVSAAACIQRAYRLHRARVVYSGKRGAAKAAAWLNVTSSAAVGADEHHQQQAEHISGSVNRDDEILAAPPRHPVEQSQPPTQTDSLRPLDDLAPPSHAEHNVEESHHVESTERDGDDGQEGVTAMQATTSEGNSKSEADREEEEEEEEEESAEEEKQQTSAPVDSVVQDVNEANQDKQTPEVPVPSCAATQDIPQDIPLSSKELPNDTVSLLPQSRRQQRLAQRRALAAQKLTKYLSRVTFPQRRILIPTTAMHGGGGGGRGSIGGQQANPLTETVLVLPRRLMDLFLDAALPSCHRSSAVVDVTDALYPFGGGIFVSAAATASQAEGTSNIPRFGKALYADFGCFLGPRMVRDPTSLLIRSAPVVVLPRRDMLSRRCVSPILDALVCVRFKNRSHSVSCLRRSLNMCHSSTLIASQGAYCPVFTLSELNQLVAVSMIQRCWRAWTERKKTHQGNAVPGDMTRAVPQQMLDDMRRTLQEATKMKLSAPLKTAKRVAEWCSRCWKRRLARRRLQYLRTVTQAARIHSMDQSGGGGEVILTANTWLQIADLSKLQQQQQRHDKRKDASSMSLPASALSPSLSLPSGDEGSTHQHHYHRCLLPERRFLSTSLRLFQHNAASSAAAAFHQQGTNGHHNVNEDGSSPGAAADAAQSFTGEASIMYGGDDGAWLDRSRADSMATSMALMPTSTIAFGTVGSGGGTNDTGSEWYDDTLAEAAHSATAYSPLRNPPASTIPNTPDAMPTAISSLFKTDPRGIIHVEPTLRREMVKVLPRPLQQALELGDEEATLSSRDDPRRGTFRLPATDRVLYRTINWHPRECSLPTLLDITMRGAAVTCFTHSAPGCLEKKVPLASASDWQAIVKGDASLAQTLTTASGGGGGGGAGDGTHQRSTQLTGAQAFKRRRRRKASEVAARQGSDTVSFSEMTSKLEHLCKMHPEGYMVLKFPTSHQAYLRQLLLLTLSYDEKEGNYLCYDTQRRALELIAVRRIERWWLRRLADRRQRRRSSKPGIITNSSSSAVGHPSSRSRSLQHERRFHNAAAVRTIPLRPAPPCTSRPASAVVSSQATRRGVNKDVTVVPSPSPPPPFQLCSNTSRLISPVEQRSSVSFGLETSSSGVVASVSARQKWSRPLLSASSKVPAARMPTTDARMNGGTSSPFLPSVHELGGEEEEDTVNNLDLVTVPTSSSVLDQTQPFVDPRKIFSGAGQQESASPTTAMMKEEEGEGDMKKTKSTHSSLPNDNISPVVAAASGDGVGVSTAESCSIDQNETKKNVEGTEGQNTLPCDVPRSHSFPPPLHCAPAPAAPAAATISTSSGAKYLTQTRTVSPAVFQPLLPPSDADVLLTMRMSAVVERPGLMTPRPPSAKQLPDSGSSSYSSTNGGPVDRSRAVTLARDLRVIRDKQVESLIEQRRAQQQHDDQRKKDVVARARYMERTKKLRRDVQRVAATTTMIPSSRTRSASMSSRKREETSDSAGAGDDAYLRLVDERVHHRPQSSRTPQTPLAERT